MITSVTSSFRTLSVDVRVIFIKHAKNQDYAQYAALPLNIRCATAYKFVKYELKSLINNHHSITCWHQILTKQLRNPHNAAKQLISFCPTRSAHAWNDVILWRSMRSLNYVLTIPVHEKIAGCRLTAKGRCDNRTSRIQSYIWRTARYYVVWLSVNGSSSEARKVVWFFRRGMIHGEFTQHSAKLLLNSLSIRRRELF